MPGGSTPPPGTGHPDPGGHERHDQPVHHGPDLVGHLAGRFRGGDAQLDALGLVPPSHSSSRRRRQPRRRLRLAGCERRCVAEPMLSCSAPASASHSSCSARRNSAPRSRRVGRSRRLRMVRQVRFPASASRCPAYILDRADLRYACTAALGQQQRFRRAVERHRPAACWTSQQQILGRFRLAPARTPRASAGTICSSASVSSSQLQSTTARSVLCRGNAVRLPPVSRRNRSSTVGELIEGHGAQPGRGQFDRQRHPVQRPADAHHRRATSGRRRRDPCAPRRPGPAATGRLGGLHPGLASPSGTASGSTSHSASPVMPSGSLLVARIRSR